MRTMTVAFTLGTALALCNLGTFSVAAQKAKVVREPRPIITVPAVRTTPYRDYLLFHDIVIALRTTGSIHAAGPSCR